MYLTFFFSSFSHSFIHFSFVDLKPRLCCFLFMMRWRKQAEKQMKMFFFCHFPSLTDETYSNYVNKIAFEMKRGQLLNSILVMFFNQKCFCKYRLWHDSHARSIALFHAKVNKVNLAWRPRFFHDVRNKIENQKQQQTDKGKRPCSIALDWHNVKLPIEIEPKINNRRTRQKCFSMRERKKGNFFYQIFKIDIFYRSCVGWCGLWHAHKRVDVNWRKWNLHIERFRGRSKVIKNANKCSLQSLSTDRGEEGAKGNK